jgi:hypothetical protein
MIKTIIYLLISLIAIVLLHWILYGSNITYESLADVFFYVGIMMFFGGILTITNVARLFAGATYIVRSFSKEFRERYKNYHEYHDAKVVNVEKGIYGGRVIIIGVIYIAISIYFALQFFNQY